MQNTKQGWSLKFSESRWALPFVTWRRDGCGRELAETTRAKHKSPHLGECQWPPPSQWCLPSANPVSCLGLWCESHPSPKLLVLLLLCTEPMHSWHFQAGTALRARQQVGLERRRGSAYPRLHTQKSHGNDKHAIPLFWSLLSQRLRKRQLEEC